MPQLFFIRHGQTEANVKWILTGRLETNLTQKGIDDAIALSEELTEEFDYYYCSPLTRTHQTLRAIKGDVDFIIDESITESLLNLNVHLSEYEPSYDDEFIIIDVSNKDYFDKIVDDGRIIQIIDHHTGFEEYWKNLLNEKSRIEFIGSVATIIVEEYENDNLLPSMSKEIAILLMSAILDNTLNFKAKVTNERDVVAYRKLAKIVGNIDNYEEKYFLECQKNIETNLVNSLENDTKIEKICEILPQAFSQLTLWNKKFVFENIDIIYKTLNRISEEWMLNLISLEDGKSYIIANNECVKKKLEK